jgi:hypothetical protein
MKVVGLALVGFFLGAIAGGVVGVICGLIWTKVFHTSSFEGYDGMLVFMTFMPIGILAGGSLGAAHLLMWRRATRRRDAASRQAA